MSVRVPSEMATRLTQLAGFVLLTATVAAAPLRGSMDATADMAPVIQRDGFRVSSWNVAESSFVRHPDTFRSVLRIVDADIFLFDEVGGETDAPKLLQVLHGLRNASDTVWHLAWGEGGEYQRGVIASRTPVERVPEFAPLRYPRSIGPIVARETDAKRAALQRNVDGGVGANAAIVTQNGRRLLLVTVDLWARGAAGSWEEARRRVEASAIRDAMSRSLQRAANERRQIAAVILGGDLNLVAGRAPLDSLLGGMFNGRRSLSVAPAFHPDRLADWTWDGRGTAFHSRRMDFVLFERNALDVLSGRVFDSEQQTASDSARASLMADASASLSRHRPVVIDFRWRR